MYRDQLPQLSGRPFLTDGGLETTLIFHQGRELPEFAAFPLVTDDEGVAILADYLADYVAIARRHGAGFLLESVTWRASEDWGAKLGFSRADLAAANRRAVELLTQARDELPDEIPEAVVSGCIGPRGDGYDASHRMSANQAREYHAFQMETFAGTEADMVTAMTMTYSDEAIGVVNAARSVGIPAAISFTVETDGALPSGEPLGEAIERTDDATGGAAAYFMINCAHPTHFSPVLTGNQAWRERIRGVRANASTMSHAELDNSEELDEGDPHDLGLRCAKLRELLPELNVYGGCCGTDHRHLAAIARECL